MTRLKLFIAWLKVALFGRRQVRDTVKTILGSSSRLVFPGMGVAFVKTAYGDWVREGSLVPDAVHALRRMGIPNSARIAAGLQLAGWTNVEEQDILEYWFAGTALTNTSSHIGLFTTTPADDGTGGVEATGGSYAREAFATNGTNWGSSAAGAPSTIANLVAVTFTQASANWGTVTSWGYFTALTVGTLTFFAALDTSKAVDSGDTAELAIGAMVGQLGDPGDSY